MAARAVVERGGERRGGMGGRSGATGTRGFPSAHSPTSRVVSAGDAGALSVRSTHADSPGAGPGGPSAAAIVTHTGQ